MHHPKRQYGIDEKKQKARTLSTIIIAAIAIIVALIATLALFYRSKPVPSASIQTSPAPSLPTAIAERSDAIYHGPRPTQSAAGLPGPCQAFANGLSALNLKTAFDPKRKLALVFSNQCRELSPAIRDTWDKLQAQCGRYQELSGGKHDRDWNESRAGCYVNLTIFRAQLTDYLTRDVPLSEITDPRVLADKTIARWLQNPGSAAEAAERLLELEPKLYPAAKIATMGRFLENRQRMASGGEVSWDKVDSHLSLARDLGPTDRRYLTEVEYALEISKARNPAEIQSRVAQVAKQSEDPGLAHFYSAYAQHREGNRTEAMAELRRAAEADPGNSRYQEALRIFQSAPPGTQVSVWSLEMTVPLDKTLPE